MSAFDENVKAISDELGRCHAKIEAMTPVVRYAIEWKKAKDSFGESGGTEMIPLDMAEDYLLDAINELIAVREYQKVTNG